MNKIFKLVIYKNKVWLDMYINDIPLNTQCVFTGNTKRECIEWVKENKEKYENR